MAFYNENYLYTHLSEDIITEGFLDKVRKSSREAIMKDARFVQKNLISISLPELKIYLSRFTKNLNNKKVFPDSCPERKELEDIIGNIKNEISSRKNKNIPIKTSNKPPKVIHVYTDEEKDIIDKEVHAVVTRFNKDPKIKERILEIVKNSKMDLDKEEQKFFKFIADLFEDDGSYLIYEVCSQSQEYCITINDITYEIAKEVEKAINAKGVSGSVDIGDGDEGCIYIEC